MHDYQQGDKFRNYNDPEVYDTAEDAAEAKRQRARQQTPSSAAPEPDMSNTDPVGCTLLLLPSLCFYGFCVYPAMGASAMLALSSQPLRLIGLVCYSAWWVISTIMLLPCLLTPLMTNKVVAGVITFILMFLWMAVLNAFIARKWAQKRKMMKKVLLGVVLLTVVPVLLAWFAHATGLIDAYWWERGWAGYDPLTGLFFRGHVGEAFRGGRY